jgi:hypothetical protein
MSTEPQVNNQHHPLSYCALNAFNVYWGMGIHSKPIGKFFREPSGLRPRYASQPIPPLTPCGYCFDNWATCWDHLLPFSHGGLTIASNLYPACRRCNHLLGAKMFATIEEKREYVRQKLIEKGTWKTADSTDNGRLSDMPEAILQSSPPSILLGQVPMGRLVETKDRTKREPVICAYCKTEFIPVRAGFRKFCRSICCSRFRRLILVK